VKDRGEPAPVIVRVVVEAAPPADADKSLTRTLTAIRMPVDGTAQHDSFADEFDLRTPPSARISCETKLAESERGRAHARLDPAGLIPLVAV